MPLLFWVEKGSFEFAAENVNKSGFSWGHTIPLLKIDD